METFSKHTSSGLLILKFRLVDRVVEDLFLFGIPSVLDASLFKQYDVQVYKQTSRRSSTCMPGTMNKVERQLHSSNFDIIIHTLETEVKTEASKKKRALRNKAFLVRGGENVVMSRIFFVVT